MGLFPVNVDCERLHVREIPEDEELLLDPASSDATSSLLPFDLYRRRPPPMIVSDDVFFSFVHENKSSRSDLNCHKSDNSPSGIPQ